MSASCTHVSALLQALVAMTPVQFQLRPSNPPSLSLEEDNLPVTSYLCQLKPPRKRKEERGHSSNAAAHFHEHTYGKPKKRVVKQVEDFDPRPNEYKRTASYHLPGLLDGIRGEYLSISLLLAIRMKQI